jgi:hypothetical protein
LGSGSPSFVNRERLGGFEMEILFEPVISDAERAMILLQMSRAAYEANPQTTPWDELPSGTKEEWMRAVRASLRVMFGVIKPLSEE